MSILLTLVLISNVGEYRLQPNTSIIETTALDAGNSLILESKDPISIDNKPMYLIDKNLQIGGISIYSKEYIRLHFYKASYGTLFRKILPIEYKNIKINKPLLESKNKLQIPQHTWKKVSQEEQILADRMILQESLQTNYDFPFPTSNWIKPLQSKKVSEFAASRTLPNGKSYYHSGVDYRAFTPQNIVSTQDGVVVLARHFLVPGNLISIYHGGGFFSRYMHLSEIVVKEGDVVTKGQYIGKTGATGRVEAPHLHWEILWRGYHIDPEKFILSHKVVSSDLPQ